MILVSFSFAEDALLNDVKMTLLDCRVLKIHRSAFLGHPVQGKEASWAWIFQRCFIINVSWQNMFWRMMN